MAKKKKLASTFPNMVIVLSIIAVISGLSLAFTYTSTKDAIELGKKKKTLKAIKAVVPEFDNNPDADKYKIDGYPKFEFYPAKKGGELVGTAVKAVSDKGFTTDVWIMVGFDKDLKIYNTSILDHKETPGLGTKMAEPKFKDQFNGKDPASYNLSVTKDGGSVDAIAAATISSRAFCDAAKKAYEALKKGGKK